MAKDRTVPSDLGEILIANEDLSIITGLAATKVEGVASMSGGIAGGLAEALAPSPSAARIHPKDKLRAKR